MHELPPLQQVGTDFAKSMHISTLSGNVERVLTVVRNAAAIEELSAAQRLTMVDAVRNTIRVLPEGLPSDPDIAGILVFTSVLMLRVDDMQTTYRNSQGLDEESLALLTQFNGFLQTSEPTANPFYERTRTRRSQGDEIEAKIGRAHV